MQKERIFPGAHKIGAAISGPRIAGRKFYGRIAEDFSETGPEPKMAEKWLTESPAAIFRGVPKWPDSQKNWRFAATFGSGTVSHSVAGQPSRNLTVYYLCMKCSFCHLDFVKVFPRFGRKISAEIGESRLKSAKNRPTFDSNSTENRLNLS